MDKINWINGQAGGTPLSAENLNLMEDNIETAINTVAENGTPTVLATLTSGTSGTVSVEDLSQFRFIVLQATYHNDTNRVLASTFGTYQQFKSVSGNHPWEAAFKDGSTIDVSALYNSDTSVTLNRKGSSDCAVLLGIK